MKRSGPKFVKLDHWLMDQPSYVSLSLGARCLLTELIKRYTGSNNGSICLPSREAAKRLAKRRDAVMRYYRELEAAGFIVETSPARLGVDGTGRASKWRLTHLPAGNIAPTFDFKKTEPRPDNRATPARLSGQEEQRNTENPGKVARLSGQANANTLHDNRANLTSSHRPRFFSHAAVGQIQMDARVFKSRRALGEFLSQVPVGKSHRPSSAANSPMVSK